MESRPTILIVDDDASFGLMFSNLIRGLGFHVLTTLYASNVPIYELSEGDIIFLFLVMPGTNGFDVLRTLSKHNSKCSIVLMSGSPARIDEAESLAKQLELKLIGILHKPFRLENVKYVLEGALGVSK